jgi:ubiquinone/menaquinone biosynthesis C-methylase UbiE
MNSMTTGSAGYFGRVADQWDALRAGYFSEAVRAAGITKAYLRPEMVVADVGTGTGFMAAGLAPLVSKVYALDGSPAMLEVAQRNLAGAQNVVFLEVDGSTLALDDASMDAVFANMYLHHCPDPLAAIRAMARVLKPGGRLVITDLDRHELEWMRREMADEWLGFDRSQVKTWLREAGLVNALVDCTDQTCCATSGTRAGERETGRAEVGVFVAVGTRRVTGTREAVRANYGAIAARGGSCCQSEAAPAGFAADIPLSASCCAPAPVEFTADIPLSTGGGCCAPANAMTEVVVDAQAVVWDTGYTSEQLAVIPSEAAEISLGCGNPTALASLRPGEVVLDIGSGGGIDAFYAAQRVGPEGRVIGVDMTPSMIERARRAAARAGLSSVEFRLGQAEAMPVEDATADVILSNCVINLCEDKGRVFEEAYRVLKEGGRLAISDMVTDRALPASLRGDSGAWAGCVSGALPEQEYVDLVRGAGFSDVRVARSRSGGDVAGVAVYSLAVTARKAPAADGSA